MTNGLIFVAIVSTAWLTSECEKRVGAEGRKEEKDAWSNMESLWNESGKQDAGERTAGTGIRKSKEGEGEVVDSDSSKLHSTETGSDTTSVECDVEKS